MRTILCKPKSAPTPRVVHTFPPDPPKLFPKHLRAAVLGFKRSLDPHDKGDLGYHVSSHNDRLHAFTINGLEIRIFLGDTDWELEAVSERRQETIRREVITKQVREAMAAPSYKGWTGWAGMPEERKIELIVQYETYVFYGKALAQLKDALQEPDRLKSLIERREAEIEDKIVQQVKTMQVAHAKEMATLQDRLKYATLYAERFR